MRAFVIRLWTPADEVEAHTQRAPELRGVVEQVGSPDETPFSSDRELLELLREGVQGRAEVSGTAGERRR